MTIKMTINIKKYELEDCYFCKTCRYKCDTKFLIKQHLSTKKHRNQQQENPDSQELKVKKITSNSNLTPPTKPYMCTKCKNTYK